LFFYPLITLLEGAYTLLVFRTDFKLTVDLFTKRLVLDLEAIDF
jgi:hypothetical protein